MRNTLLILSLFAALVASSFWFAAADLPEITDADRTLAQADGKAHAFADLSEGKVHYRLEGPERGPVVLLIHGFRTPSFVWNDHVEPLTDAGFRVLAFDNFGRGFSDRPGGDYTAERTDRLLTELLDRLDITRPVHLVGYSMGGATAAFFAVNHPHKVRSLTLIAPAGTGEKPFMAQLLSVPVLGDWIMRHMGDRMGRDNAAASAAKSPNRDAFLAHYEAQAGFAGYSDALLSTLRHYPLWGAEPVYEALGRSDLPVQIIWGEADEVVPFGQSEIVQGLLPGAALKSFSGIGHAITYSHPGDVNALLVAFVGQHRLRQAPGGAGGKARGPEARLDPADCLCHTD